MGHMLGLERREAGLDSAVVGIELATDRYLLFDGRALHRLNVNYRRSAIDKAEAVNRAGVLLEEVNRHLDSVPLDLVIHQELFVGVRVRHQLRREHFLIVEVVVHRFGDLVDRCSPISRRLQNIRIDGGETLGLERRQDLRHARQAFAVKGVFVLFLVELKAHRASPLSRSRCAGRWRRTLSCCRRGRTLSSSCRPR